MEACRGWVTRVRVCCLSLFFFVMSSSLLLWPIHGCRLFTTHVLFPLLDSCRLGARLQKSFRGSIVGSRHIKYNLSKPSINTSVLINQRHCNNTTQVASTVFSSIALRAAIVFALKTNLPLGMKIHFRKQVSTSHSLGTQPSSNK